MNADGTGLKIYGEGEWDQKHGIRSHRRWRKLHLGVDADTHKIVATELTPDDVGHVSELPGRLDQVDAGIASLTADGAYDGEVVYDAVANRHPDVEIIIPPRATAVPNETTAMQRDRHITTIEKHGRMGWQRRSGYNRRSLVETAGVSIQDRYWPTTSGSTSAYAADRGKDWMQRTQLDDEFRHAGLSSNPPIPNPADRCRHQAVHAPKRRRRLC